MSAASPTIQAGRDCEPHFREDNVIFVTNLLALFFGNAEETEALRTEVGEIDSYGGRLIPILNLLFRGKGENRLLLECAPDPALCAYFDAELGLSLPRTEVLTHDDYLNFRNAVAPEKLADWQDSAANWMDGYVTDPVLKELSEHLGKRTLSSETASRNGNNKVLLHQHLAAAGLPVFDTVLAESPDQISAATEKLQALGYRSAAVRAAIGASGIGMTKVNFAAAESAVPNHFFHEGPCLVQGWIEAGHRDVEQLYSPSIQLFLSDDSIQLYDLTEQILSHDSIHQGNEAPPRWLSRDDRCSEVVREELFRQAGVAGTWLYEQGYRGTGSVDFIVIKNTSRDTPGVYVCEINARVTGATYPAILAKHLAPDGAWLLRNLRLSAPLEGETVLEMLRSPGHLYHPGCHDNTGILPVNFNFGRDGRVHKGQFLCLAPDPESCRETLELAKLNLPVTMQDERD